MNFFTPFRRASNVSAAPVSASIAAMITITLTGCAVMETPQPQYYIKPMSAALETTTNEAKFTVIWSNQSELLQYCGKNVRGCVKNMGGGFWVMYTRKPTDWQDITAMVVIGHEVMHVLGATHE